MKILGKLFSNWKKPCLLLALYISSASCAVVSITELQTEIDASANTSARTISLTGLISHNQVGPNRIPMNGGGLYVKP